MKLKGKKLSTPNEELIILPRGDNEPIILRARAVLDMDDFDRLCPRPKPPTLMLRGGVKSQDLDDPRYIERMQEYGERRTAYMILKSLEATEDLEWEECDVENPDSWLNYEKELKNSGFSSIEINRIIMGVMNANSLNDERIEEARKAFLASQPGQNGSLSHQEEASFT